MTAARSGSGRSSAVSTDVPQLTPELLDRFRAALAAAGAPLADAIEPGLSDRQIDRIARRLRVKAPPELRTLWRWGAAPSRPLHRDAWSLNSEFDLWPPEIAIRETKAHRKDRSVSRSTISFGGPSGAGYLLVEGDAAMTHSRVMYSLIEDPDPFEAAPSLGALFTLWTTQLEQGAYRHVDGQWHDPEEPLLFIKPDGGWELG